MRSLIWLCALLLPGIGNGQHADFPMDTIPLTDMSAFKPAKPNWRIVGDVRATLEAREAMEIFPGTGMLANIPDVQNRDNLVFGFEHGDLDLELDLMMASHSNSGIYLQGRYEVQLLDSWGKKSPTFGDIGGVYERWDDSKPEGQKGYQGIPPRQNPARAPGLWQHLRIEFQAPRFDAAGKKTANAKLLRVALNGITVQENVELSGPTRGPSFPGEAALGPLVIQGDHGPVAFRNIRYRTYDQKKMQLSGLEYRYFAGEHEYLPDFTKIKADERGAAQGLSWEFARGDNDFALQFTGTLQVPEAGRYAFVLNSTGNSMLKVRGDTLIGQGWWQRKASVELPAGPVPVEITYCKAAEWAQPTLALWIEGLHFRPTPLHLASSAAASTPAAPILVETGKEPELLRCFIDIPQGEKGKKRIVHAISVGYPEQTNFTYDLDNGALVQVWREGFLDATPMWNDRGDGHANPLGSVVLLGDAPVLGPATDIWPDTLAASAGYRLKGYQLDFEGIPAFRYSAYGAEVTDCVKPEKNGKGLTRELAFSGNTAALQFRIATGKDMVKVGKNLWAVDDKRYYIQLPEGIVPQIRSKAGLAEMFLPASAPVRYDIIW